MSAPGYKHHPVPQSDRDVNCVICTNGEPTVFHYKGKSFKSYQRITAKPPSCLHFLREPLKCFPISVHFHCLIMVSEECGLWESSTILCPKLERNVCSAAAACSVQAATITEKRIGCKGMSPLHLSLHLSAQDSEVRSAASPG